MSHFKRKRGRYQQTSRSRASDYVYPPVPGSSKRQARAGSVRRILASMAAVREYLNA